MPSRRCWVAAAVALLLTEPPLSWAGERPNAVPKVVRSEATRLVEEGTRAGVDRSRLEALVRRLSRAGLSAEASRQVLYPAFDAARTGLPSNVVLEKVEEGLLKKAAPLALAEASRRRLEALRRARKLLSAANLAPGSRRSQPLLLTTALALESGVTDQLLDATLDRAGGRSSSQVKSAVEAAEALWLAGLEPAIVEALAADCLNRNLKRADVLRVVRFAEEKKRQGMAGAAIREALWKAAGKAARPPAVMPRPAAPGVNSRDPSATPPGAPRAAAP
jgi:hypothetical protein